MGENYGTVSGCAFTGTVTGTDTVGLIAGYNGDGGIIADCAAVGEFFCGAGQGTRDFVVVTLGTGIGTALIFNGELIPNTELGHLELLKGKGDAEKYAASSIREKLDMGYKKWAKRLTKYYSLMEFYFDPQLFVVGGGVSRVSEKFLPYIDIKTPIVAAKLHNEAGIIGAAYYASTKQK